MILLLKALITLILGMLSIVAIEGAMELLNMPSNSLFMLGVVSIFLAPASLYMAIKSIWKS